MSKSRWERFKDWCKVYPTLKQQAKVKINTRVNSIINSCSVLDSYVDFADNQLHHENNELSAALGAINYG